MVQLVVPEEYGQVLGVAVASSLLLTWLGAKVGGARKAAGVKYPYMYAEKAEAEKDSKKNVFNCVQRAHQNTLEGYPTFLTLLLVGGLKYPQISAGAGAVWIAGRIVYAVGYSTGDSEKRKRGAFLYAGLLTLLYTSSATVYHLLT